MHALRDILGDTCDDICLNRRKSVGDGGKTWGRCRFGEHGSLRLNSSVSSSPKGEAHVSGFIPEQEQMAKFSERKA